MHGVHVFTVQMCSAAVLVCIIMIVSGCMSISVCMYAFAHVCSTVHVCGLVHVCRVSLHGCNVCF